MAYRKLDKEKKKKKDSQRSATKSQSPLALMSSAGTSSGSVDLPFFKLSSFFPSSFQVFRSSQSLFDGNERNIQLASAARSCNLNWSLNRCRSSRKKDAKVSGISAFCLLLSFSFSFSSLFGECLLRAF